MCIILEKNKLNVEKVERILKIFLQAVSNDSRVRRKSSPANGNSINSSLIRYKSEFSSRLTPFRRKAQSPFNFDKLFHKNK